MLNVSAAVVVGAESPDAPLCTTVNVYVPLGRRALRSVVRFQLPELPTVVIPTSMPDGTTAKRAVPPPPPPIDWAVAVTVFPGSPVPESVNTPAGETDASPINGAAGGAGEPVTGGAVAESGKTVTGASEELADAESTGGMPGSDGGMVGAGDGAVDESGAGVDTAAGGAA